MRVVRSARPDPTSDVGRPVIELIAPNGTRYLLKRPNPFDSQPNVDASYVVNGARVGRNGTWRLRIRDTFRDDSGTLINWALTPQPTQ